jgi:hypothetical protein
VLQEQHQKRHPEMHEHLAKGTGAPS